ncbi:hypothetical protein BRD10_02235 [Halobacteriales archaeon SW_12_71_31]|nr:MAG: hypothetical protein BRD10_02235 [Halobacteriales archaeon SW_12_71_31]
MFEVLFIGGIPGGPEMLIVLLLAVLLFGASKIPKLARASGEAIGEFRKGREEVETELQEMRDTGADRHERPKRVKCRWFESRHARSPASNGEP